MPAHNPPRKQPVVSLAMPPEDGHAPVNGTALSDEEIHGRLIEAIVDQRLLPGTKLVEDKLGQVFGVSRTRIRQVLIRLAQEQVVTILPNKGASIAEPTVVESREVFEARSVVEAVLVRRFIERAKASDLRALGACITAEEAARKHGDHAMALRQSGQFHLLLAQAAGHATFEGFLRKLVSRTSLILMSYAPNEPSRDRPEGRSSRWVHACRCEEHRSLLAALKAAVKGSASPEEAVALMASHLAHIEASLCFSQPQRRFDDVWRALGDAHRPEPS